MDKDIKGVNEYESLWDSFNKIPATLTSLANGIGTIANKEKLFDPGAWSEMWHEVTQEKESALGEGGGEGGEGGERGREGAAAESPPTKGILETLTNMQSTLMEALFRGESSRLEEKKPPSTPPIQSKQDEIRQLLEAKINEGVPTGVGTTEKEILEHKVKNLYAIFFELKYQRIDEILQKTTSTTYTPKDKIDEVKKFQEEFRLDLRIENENELQDTLFLLNRKIEKNNLNIEEANLTTPKFTPSSYDNKDALLHLTHSKHYLDGILKDDGINAEKRIEAAKLFVKQLELISEPGNSGMATVHKQFVKFQAEKVSGDVTKIVDEGAKFAKSIEALASGDEPTSFLGTDGRVLKYQEYQEYHFHDSVVKYEVEQRDVVIRKFTERLSGLSSVLKSEAIINNKIDEIFDDTKIIYEINPLTKKITFTDPNPPVGAVVAGVGAGAGADAPAADVAAAGADTPAVAPANPFTDISFVGLSNEDILRRLLVLKYVTEGIMEAEGKDVDKEKAIAFLIAEMKTTTDPRYSAQNVSYQNRINSMTSDGNGRVIILKSNPTENSASVIKKINSLKDIGKNFLERVKNNPSDSFLMSDIAMQEIYSEAEKKLKRESTEKTITEPPEINKYLLAVNKFQRDEIREILKKTDVNASQKTEEIEAILKLSLTYDDHSSQLKIKTTRGNLKKIEKLIGNIQDYNTLLRDDSILMQSYFSNLYKGALTTENVDDDQKILGLRAINIINSVANDDRSFLNFKKIKDQSAKDNAIASGKAITEAVKAEHFDGNEEIVKNFSWEDTGEIDQKKLKTSHDKYLKKEKAGAGAGAGDAEEIKSKGNFLSYLTSFSKCFGCLRSGKPKDLTEGEKERKTALLKLGDIKSKNGTLTIEEPKDALKNNIFYRITKAIMDDILTNENSKNQLESLKKLMNLKTDSVNNFFDDFSKNSDLKVPTSESYWRNIGTGSSYSSNYFHKFCQAILDSENKDEINDNKKLLALKLFLAEQKNGSLQPINKEIADGNPDKKIQDKVKTFLKEVSKMKEGETVYSDDRIKAKMDELKAAATTSTPANVLAPATALTPLQTQKSFRL